MKKPGSVSPKSPIVTQKAADFKTIQQPLESNLVRYQPQPALYHTVDETKDDIARLILLEDFDGIKKRV
jgi:hypothetical protein